MPIQFVKEKNIFVLHTAQTTYAFGIDNLGLLRHLYWGKRIDHIADFEIPDLAEISSNDPVLDLTLEEFPVFGGMRYKETCLKACFSDGTRDLEYKYVKYALKDNSLQVILRDTFYGLEISLDYTIHETQDLIERKATVTNHMDTDVAIEAIYSGQLHIPHQNLTLTATHGHWLAEFQEFKQKLGMGKTVLENRRGISTHNHNPFFILDNGATETLGDVYYGALKWSGNFKAVIEPRPYGTTLIQMGVNPHDCQLTLKAGDSFTTPEMIFGYTVGGFGTMSRNLHDYARKNLLQGADRPVLYNSWEATFFDVKSEEQIKLAKKASEMGVELFVIDDGWFGNRNSDADGLGDWYVNPEKFPDGLNPLIREVKSLGMKFGIWIEPEMVNPPTELMKKNPNWIYHSKNRQPDTSRNQMVLNLTLPEVKNFIFNMIDDLLANHDIDYIKWDANRPISQIGMTKEAGIRHVEAVYEIVQQIKQKYPQLLIEACASGGGRVDYGSLSYFDDFWTSDNTDPFDRLTIHKTYSYIYPIKAMRAWVTDHHYRPHLPLSFKFHSAMMGSLGMGCNILNFSEEEITESKQFIEAYKKIRPIIQNGDFYRLEHNSTNAYHLFEYTYGEEALLFAFLPQSHIYRASVNIKLQGLDENVDYSFSIPVARSANEIYEGLKSGNLTTKTKSGAYLMNHGIDLKLEGDYASTIIHFKKGE
ncbi:MAG: alpha-galactosidase [Turicibacter sp.]|nr:alpha-galactosidase [Turicibacter sp.]